MPGTPIIEPEKPKDLLTFAHKRAVEIAGKTADPILQPQAFHRIYWVVMGGYGFAPYVPGI